MNRLWLICELVAVTEELMTDEVQDQICEVKCDVTVQHTHVAVVWEAAIICDWPYMAGRKGLHWFIGWFSSHIRMFNNHILYVRVIPWIHYSISATWLQIWLLLRTIHLKGRIQLSCREFDWRSTGCRFKSPPYWTSLWITVSGKWIQYCYCYKH